MSYIPHEWTNGETVTASKLNHIEEGISNSNGGISIVTDINSTLSHTWQEIYDIVNNGGIVFLSSIDNNSPYNDISMSPLVRIGVNLGQYAIVFYYNTYSCSSPNDYPSFDESTIVK